MTALSFNLLVLRSPDPARLADFYGHLGLAFVEQRHGAGPLHYAARHNNLVLAIYPAGSDTTKTTNLRIGFDTHNIQKMVATAEQAGAVVLSAPADTSTGLRAMVKDPDGNKIDFIQPKEP